VYVARDEDDINTGDDDNSDWEHFGVASDNPRPAHNAPEFGPGGGKANGKKPKHDGDNEPEPPKDKAHPGSDPRSIKLGPGAGAPPKPKKPCKSTKKPNKGRGRRGSMQFSYHVGGPDPDSFDVKGKIPPQVLQQLLGVLG
jgi:hypothetical protein